MQNSKGPCSVDQACQFFTCSLAGMSFYGGMCAPNGSPWLAQMSTMMAQIQVGLTCSATIVEPAPITSAYMVNLTLSMPIAVANFNASVRVAVRQALAVAAGMQKTDYARVVMTYVATTSIRRLLADGVSISATLNMPDAASATKAATLLTAANINSGLQAAGLPSATITKAPTGSPAARASPPGALVAVCSAAAALLLSMRAGPAMACR
jgi:hypothetical protein